MPKTSSFPKIRVEPALRQAAENLLNENETLSGFIEEAVRLQVDRRQEDADFLKRALASDEKAKKTNIYYSAEEVDDMITGIINSAMKK